MNQKKDKNHGNSLLKKLLEVRSRIISDPDTKSSLLIIGISNNARVPEFFSNKVADRFGEEEIKFSKYNSLELRQILEVREKKAFKPNTLKDGVISKTAAVTTKNGGSARQAIKLLKKAGQIAMESEKEKVSKDEVDEAREMIEKNRIIETVESLDKHTQILLYGIFETDEHSGLNTGEVYESYQNICRHIDEEPVSQRRIRDLIGELDMLGLVKAPIKNKGRYGRTREISLQVSPSDVEEIRDLVDEDLMIEPDLL